MTAARRTQLARLGIWIGLATVAVLTAVLTARTETGVRRIANLLSPASSEIARNNIGPQIASRQVDQEAEQRRLGELVRTLAADRDRLVARLGAVERNLDDVTGSIPRPETANPASRPLPQIQPAPPPAVVSAPPTVVAPAPQAAAPPPAATAPASAPPTPQAAAQPSIQLPPNRVAAGHLATGAPSAIESVATKTEFGIDVGGNASVDGLRALWLSLKTAQPALFDGLRPVIAIREGAKPGTIELRLLAGPVPNVGIAARLCATLTAAGQTCQPAVFDGQKLALQ